MIACDTDGGVFSFIIINKLDLVHHPELSNISILMVVVHSIGVNEYSNSLLLSIISHEFIEYLTIVLGDGHAVSFILQVIGPA
jgi:hypothetical protein